MNLCALCEQQLRFTTKLLFGQGKLKDKRELCGSCVMKLKGIVPGSTKLRDYSISDIRGLLGYSMVNMTSETLENVVTLTLSFNEDELIRRIEDSTLFEKEYQESATDIAGFYGLEEKSTNSEFCVVYSEAHCENDVLKGGELALIKNGKVVYYKSDVNVSDVKVSDGGGVIYHDCLRRLHLEGLIIILCDAGEEVYRQYVTVNIDQIWISNDGNFAIFNTANGKSRDANSMFVIDVAERKVLSKFPDSFLYDKLEIDSLRKIIVLESRKYELNYSIDFYGNELE
jgi:hypothetical protein